MCGRFLEVVCGLKLTKITKIITGGEMDLIDFWHAQISAEFSVL